jgi:hypothetical protein
MKTEQKIEIMQAHEDGKSIQYRAKDKYPWYAIEKPKWDWDHCDYRVALGGSACYSFVVLRNRKTEEILLESDRAFFPREHEFLGAVNVQVTLDEVDSISANATVDYGE